MLFFFERHGPGEQVAAALDVVVHGDPQFSGGPFQRACRIAGVAADLQLASVFPETTFVEYIGGSPYVDGITKGGFAIDAEGYLAIPDRPGLGIELDRAALAKYTPDPGPLFQP